MKNFESFLTENRVFSTDQIEKIVEETADSREPIYYRLLRAYPQMEEPIWSTLADFLYTLCMKIPGRAFPSPCLLTNNET